MMQRNLNAVQDQLALMDHTAEAGGGRRSVRRTRPCYSGRSHRSHAAAGRQEGHRRSALRPPDRGADQSPAEAERPQEETRQRGSCPLPGRAGKRPVRPLWPQGENCPQG